MEQKDLKKGVVYLYYGANGGDGANILFTPKKDGSLEYDSKGFIVLHWSENRFDKGRGWETNEYLLNKTVEASNEATKYFNKCIKEKKALEGFTWHDSNKDYRKQR